MDSPTPTDEDLYKNEVPVIVKQPERDPRRALLCVQLRLSQLRGRVARVLRLQLSDEKDAELLHLLDISEDDFHALKAEQSLLVDFETFPSKLVELLAQCVAAAAHETPRF
eukprot:3112471-Pleurochrysis_carterae.AAC.1